MNLLTLKYILSCSAAAASPHPLVLHLFLLHFYFFPHLFYLDTKTPVSVSSSFVAPTMTEALTLTSDLKMPPPFKQLIQQEK